MGSRDGEGGSGKLDGGARHRFVREPDAAAARADGLDHLPLSESPSRVRSGGSQTDVAVHIELQGKWFVDDAGRECHLTPFSIRLRGGDDVALVFSCRTAVPVMKNILTGRDANWLGRYEIVGSRVQTLETLADHLVSTIPSERNSRYDTAEATSRHTQTAIEKFHLDRDRIIASRAILLVVDESLPLWAPVEHLWEPLLKLERGKGRLLVRLRAEELNTGSNEISCALEVLNSLRHTDSL